MEERERERESNVGLPKEGAFSVKVAETFMIRCDKERRCKGTVVVGRALNSVHLLNTTCWDGNTCLKVDVYYYFNKSSAIEY